MLAGMKQGCFPAGERVSGLDSNEFGVITPLTSECEI
jgi:hypothetical protein